MTKLYKVIVTPDAENDLQNIYDYIARQLFVPETAGVLQSMGAMISKSTVTKEAYL